VRLVFFAGDHGLGGRGQLGLDIIQHRRSLLRDRQSQQRHHPISLDLQQPLHQTSCLLSLQTGVAHHEANETVGVNLKIGPDLSRLRSLAADDRIALEQSPHVRHRLIRRQRPCLEHDMRGNHESALQAQHPLLRQVG